MNNYKKILSCWHKLEHFSPASVPKSKNTVVLTKEEPWNIPIVTKNSRRTIEYTIYFGVFDSTLVSEFVNKLFNDEDKDENKRNSKICFASLKLDNEGCYINDSFGISTLPWALSQLENGGIDSDNWAESFEEITNTLSSELVDFLNATPLDEEKEFEEGNIPLSFSKLKVINDVIEQVCGWSIQSKKAIFVKTEEVIKRKKDSSTSDILNSFYTKDLETILQDLNKGDIPLAFSEYLNGSLNRQNERQDLIKNSDVLRQSLTPSNYPDGCWPSNFTPSLMQQFAVNNIFNDLSDPNQEGIYSVNGPPGTGKTTLLRDIIAPIMVKRAKAMSLFEYPADAFTKVGEIKINESFSPFLYSPHKSISHGGIVIASSNNGAVENISKELPLKKEVEPFDEQVSYFKEVAENCVDSDNWGLISAVLGNKKNQNELVSKLWFNKEFDDLQKTLKNNKVSDNERWENIVREFNSKLSEVSKERLKLEIYKKEYDQFIEVSNVKSSFERKFGIIEERRIKIQQKINKQNEILSSLDERKKGILTELIIIKRNKPNFFIYWFNKTIRKEYEFSLQEILKQYNSITKEAQTVSSELHERKASFEFLLSQQNELSSRLSIVSEKYSELKSSNDKAKRDLKHNFADNSFWENIESKESQQSCPWYSEKFKKLQSELFIVALKLNEEFILNANSTSSRISTTLAGFFEYLKGEKKPTKNEVKALWDTFFIVIPIVSTTFASVQKMFEDVDKRTFPWLFVDEAGQAVPQAAAGAIWRSKRVVVVGDPLQIEPVVSIPKTLINNMSNYFGLNETHVNADLSVQSIADRINPLGSYLNINSKDIWVGIPLRVHRRCSNPMFDISNSIAYNNMMYSAVGEKTVNIKFKTSFIHCEGVVNGRHYVESQAEIIKNMLIDEIEKYKKLPDIFVITPFSEISFKLNSYLFNPLTNIIKEHNLNYDKNKIVEWLNSHIGTVHTFQGKQAEGVIMCLGLDEKTKGAAIWASIKPNLLNVALTRAKYRFVAIGDKRIWLKQPYFKELRALEQN